MGCFLIISKNDLSQLRPSRAAQLARNKEKGEGFDLVALHKLAEEHGVPAEDIETQVYRNVETTEGQVFRGKFDAVIGNDIYEQKHVEFTRSNLSSIEKQVMKYDLLKYDDERIVIVFSGRPEPEVTREWEDRLYSAGTDEIRWGYL